MKSNLAAILAVVLSCEVVQAQPAPSAQTPASIRTRYGFDKIPQYAGKTLTGAGQKIALVVCFESPTIVQDMQTFCTQFNLPPAAITKVARPGSHYTEINWFKEAAADTQLAHAIAPGAELLLICCSFSGQDNIEGFKQAKTLGATIVVYCNGWTENNGYYTYDSIFTGTTTSFVASSGDMGPNWKQWPACQPNVNSVGGTTLFSTGEYAWDKSSGGLSATYPGRHIPDLSWKADAGFVVKCGYTWYNMAGDSVGAPQFAGLLALANEGRQLTGKAPMQTTPAVLAALPATCWFDVIVGKNCTKGRDDVTGLGRPHADVLVPALINLP